jgi:hypothetical protein
VLQAETRVLIHPAVAERFALAAGRPDPQDPHIRVVPASEHIGPRPKRPTPGGERRLMGKKR